MATDTKGMIKATAADHDHFKAYLSVMKFAKEIGSDVRPYAYDPFPPLVKGGRRADGFRMVYEAVAGENWDNGLGNVHGACHAWLVDNCTTATVEKLSAPGFWGEPMSGGVSLSIDMTYYYPCPIGARLAINVVIERIGMTLGNTSCEIVDWNTGKKYARGDHVQAWSGRPLKKPAEQSKL